MALPLATDYLPPPLETVTGLFLGGNEKKRKMIHKDASYFRENWTCGKENKANLRGHEEEESCTFEVKQSCPLGT